MDILISLLICVMVGIAATIGMKTEQNPLLFTLGIIVGILMTLLFIYV